MELLTPGEKVHVVRRRAFDDDVRIHFAGIVEAASGAAVRLKGHTWIHDATENQFVRDPKEQVRLFSLSDAGHAIRILPAHVELESLEYQVRRGRMVIVDGASFEMGVHEFGVTR